MPRLSAPSLSSLAALLFSILLFPTMAHSQATAPSLVRDITPGLEKWEAGESQPVGAAGGLVFFIGSDPAHGDELWRSDGTEEGTFLLKDVVPGPGSGVPGGGWLAGDGFVFAETFYFTVSIGERRFWWKTDGTAAGTVPFLPDLQGAIRFFPAGGTLYFFRNCPGAGPCELWKSDGTLAGTVKVKTLPSPATGDVPSPAKAGGLLFFSFPGADRELWRSDGTEAGTFRIGSFDGLSVSPAAGEIGGTLLFGASEGGSGLELWKSDGTGAGTARVKDIWPGPIGSEPGAMVSLGETVFFTARDESAGRELWKTDGTEAGTVRVADIWPGADSANISSIVRVGSALFFSAEDSTGSGLWKSDGTAAGTGRVDGFPYGGYGPEYLTSANGLLFFNAIDDEHGLELWRSDGTGAGTFLVKDIEPGPGWSYPQYLTASGGTVFFYGMYPGSSGELWKSDGTAAGTVLVRELIRKESAAPFQLTGSGDQLFFGVRERPYERSLWKSDGTAAGTSLDHPTGGPAMELIDFQGSLFYTTLYSGLWSTDGTSGGPSQVFPGNSISSPRELTEAGGRLFFKSFTHLGEDLYETGAGLVKDLWPGSTLSRLSELVAVNGTLFFRADGESSGLWKSDGTEPGTLQVAGVAARQLTRVGNLLFFTVFDEPSWSYALWRSDGSPGGTFPITSWSPGDAPSELREVEGTLFFGLSRAAGGQELWKSDGTATSRVREFASRSPLAELTSVEGRLFFTAEDAAGRELWTSDGTEAGTFRVQDIYPGPAGSVPQGLTAASGWLVFTAIDPAHGREVWMSDGSASGTFLVADLAPGSRSSWPDELTLWNKKVYFSADDGPTGAELWSFEIEGEEEPEPTETRPSIEDLVVSPGSVVPVGRVVRFTVGFTDPDPNQSHTVVWSWGDGSTSGVELPPGPGGFRSVDSFHAYTQSGFYTVTVNVTDETGRSTSSSYGFIIVYDPNGPSVKGDGWIPLALGKGTFQIDADYPQNGLAPTGKLQFEAPGVDLRSESFSWLVVSGPTAWLTGEGTLKDGTSAQFWIALTDGQAPGGGGIDRMRIRIWSDGQQIFDNEPGRPNEAPPTAALGGGTVQLR